MVLFVFHVTGRRDVRRLNLTVGIGGLADLVLERFTGAFQFSHAAGKTSMEEAAADVEDDAVFLLASQTKLLTAVAALQVVERGLIAFDDNVEELLPELAAQQVLTGFDEDDKPVLVARTEGITFRYV